MTTRELTRDEWVAFFNAFSRHYRGRPITVQVAGTGDEGRPKTLARRAPLVGLTAERDRDTVTAIQVIVGDSPGAHLTHVIRDPTRVRVAQVSNGADELLLIDAEAGPTTRVDFSVKGLHDLRCPEDREGADEVL